MKTSQTKKKKKYYIEGPAQFNGQRTEIISGYVWAYSPAQAVVILVQRKEAELNGRISVFMDYNDPRVRVVEVNKKITA